MTLPSRAISSRKTAFRILKVGCSQALFDSLNRSFQLELPAEESAASPHAGGIMQLGYQCGMVWGSALAASALAYQRLGDHPTAEKEALLAAQRVTRIFAGDEGSLNCSDLVGMEMKTTLQIARYMLAGGPIRSS